MPVQNSDVSTQLNAQPDRLDLNADFINTFGCRDLVRMMTQI